jgi:hypothetical protein
VIALHSESHDERHLRLLFESALSTRYAKGFLRRDIPLDQLREVFDTWVAVGAVEPSQWAEYVSYNKEVTSYGESFQGTLISTLRESALSMTGPDRGMLESIPVGLFPLETFNGRIAATPHGGAVIVLNEAVINLLGYILRCTFAIATYQVVEPNSAPPYVDALVGLARVATSGDIVGSMKPSHLKSLESLFVPNENYTDLAITIEEFILLHEYGHFRLGHVDGGRCRPALDATTVPGLPRAHHDEFEADAYAITCLLSRYTEERVAVACGSLMHFFGLCEVLAVVFGPASQADTYLSMMESHPSGHARWERIKERTNVARRNDLSDELDDIFRYVASIAGVILLHEQLLALAERKSLGL